MLSPRSLSATNINVVTAESGKEAIQIINDEKQKVDMVLMDIMMPEMDGYETTQKIRREHKNNTLPIIAVTAKAMKGDGRNVSRRGPRIILRNLEDRPAALIDARLVL